MARAYRRAGGAALGILWLTAFPAAASDAASAPATPSPAVLLRQMYDAMGGDRSKALAGAEATGDIEVGGLKGTFTEKVDLRRGRDVLTFQAGPLSGAHGGWAGGSWWTDEKGLTTVEDTPDALTDAITESYADRDGWFDADPGPIAYVGEKTEGGATFELVRVVPPGGRAITLWIDAATHRLARTVAAGGDNREITTYDSDYRQVDGAWIPFAQRTSSGDPSTDIVTTTRTVTFRKVADAEFAPPKSAIRDARLLTDGQPAVIPFALVGGEIIVQVSVNGRPPLPFMLDSGGLNMLTPAAAKQLGLATAGALAVEGAGEGMATAGMAQVDAYRLGPVELTDQRFIVVPLPRGATDIGTQPLAGIIGYELLRRFAMRIDYHDQTLTLWPVGTAAPADSGVSAPVRTSGRDLYVEASIGGAKGLFGVDTGDAGSVTLFRSFFQGHAIPVELPAMKGFGAGIGGQGATLVTRTSDLTIGALAIPRPIVDLYFAKTGGFASDQLAGNLGNYIFRNLTITFDLPNRALYIKRSPEFGQPQPYNRLGADIGVADDGVVGVIAVDDGSPAAQAGLAVGDRLVSIDGRPVAGDSIPVLGDWIMSPAGRRTSVEVLRHGKPVDLTVTARELLPPDGALTIDPKLTP